MLTFVKCVYCTHNSYKWSYQAWSARLWLYHTLRSTTLSSFCVCAAGCSSAWLTIADRHHGIQPLALHEYLPLSSLMAHKVQPSPLVPRVLSLPSDREIFLKPAVLDFG